MSVLPSTFAVQTTRLPSGEKLPPLFSHLSLVSQEIFFVAISSNPTLSYPFTAFDVISSFLPSGEKSSQRKSCSPPCGVSRELWPVATSATKILESVPLACAWVYAIHFPSCDQIGFSFSLSAGVPVVICF